jgi:hypothetical protein
MEAPIPRLTKEQSAIIGLYTGVCCGSFADIQFLGDRLLGRPTWTHEYGDREFAERMKELAKPLFLAMCCEA